MVGLLPPDKWADLAPIFDKEFDGSILPLPREADIIADVSEAGEIESFAVAEHLIRIGQIYSKGGRNLRPLLRFLTTNFPRGASAVVIASDERFVPLLKHLKMREIEGKIFRRDF